MNRKINHVNNSGHFFTQPKFFGNSGSAKHKKEYFSGRQFLITFFLLAFGSVNTLPIGCALCFSQGIGENDQYLSQPRPGSKPVLFASDIIRIPPGVHSSAIISPDGRSILWSPMSRTEETKQSEFRDGFWSPARIIDFGIPAGITEPFFSPDGSRLYFLSFQTTESHPQALERIWFAEKENDQWGKAHPIDEVILAHPTHWQFSVAANFNIYFTSEIEGVRGEQDIYVARYENGRYTEPEDPGPAINGEGKDLTPFIAPDESYLMFARVGESTQKADIFISFKKPDQTWSTAIPLENNINTPGNDLCPVISPDGKYLFYTSPADGGYGIYWLDASFIQDMHAALIQ